MKYRVFFRLSVPFFVLVVLMLVVTVQPSKAAVLSCGRAFTGGTSIDWQGYLPQSSWHDFGRKYFALGDVITVRAAIPHSVLRIYPNTDILMNEGDHEIHVGGYAPTSFNVVIPTSGYYHFMLFNGFNHSDGPVDAYVTCVG
jgi:hypothetical protein